MANEDKNIELRSEKVRNIVGKIPPALVRYAMTIIAFVLITLFIISLIIPYRETINLSISIHSEPQAEFVKATNDGIIIIDTVFDNNEKTEIIVYEQTIDTVYQLYTHKNGKVKLLVKNKQFVKKNEIIVLNIPTENYCIYGFSDVNETEKIKIGQTVNINIDNANQTQGIISDIYKLTSNTENNKYRLKIDMQNNDNIQPQSILKGTVIISEKSFFRKIFR
ncbi:MAG: hypothetical protein LBT56_01440 [Prevotellaceae bacterium]|jgi:hypothetical protein|nr:hypothetical protein [Prevotellaceae bacterium]